MKASFSFFYSGLSQLRRQNLFFNIHLSVLGVGEKNVDDICNNEILFFCEMYSEILVGWK